MTQYKNSFIAITSLLLFASSAIAQTPIVPGGLTVDTTTSYVGIGTLTPTAPLDINIGDATPGLGNSVLRLERNGSLAFQLKNTSEAFFWNFSNASGEFRISKSGTGQQEMVLDGGGNLTIVGNIFSATCTTPCAPDYVFKPDYDLMSLKDLEKFIAQENHLPNFPSAEELVGPVNLNELQMKLLAKVEELTLYTIKQEKMIEELQDKLNSL